MGKIPQGRPSLQVCCIIFRNSAEKWEKPLIKRSTKFLLLLVVVIVAGQEAAAGVQVEQVSPRCYALIGETGQRSPENLGNNATFGLIVTDRGLVLIDPGGSEKGAAELAQTIAGINPQPVVLVINTGGQDHRWLGNHFWKARGAKVIASEAAVADQRQRMDQQLQGLRRLVGEEGMAGSRPEFADQTFRDRLDMELGGVRIELHHAGPAHTPGDSYVWLPGQQVLFSGDIVYHDRLLGVGSQSDSRSWLSVFGQIEALSPGVVVPGHGRPGAFSQAKLETGEYLRLLRQRVGEFIRQGGTLDQIGMVDQSDFSQLEVFDQLAGRNAHRVYQEMEFDF